MIPVQRPFLGPEELKLVADVFESRWLGMGSVTKQFEDRLKEMLDVRHVIAVNTGTSALHLALDALQLTPGDEVIVPSMTFVATVQAILQVGARPVFCEVSPETLNINLQDAFCRVTPRTRAIVPVHFGGVPCPMNELLAFARTRSIHIVEDAAHAFGSRYQGRPIGSLSDLTCFSFDPIKNITCGEGGAISTNDDELARRLVPRRILGIDNDTWSRYRNRRNWFYQVGSIGYRYHMSNINAAIGLAQLDRFPEFRARKRAIVSRYDAELGSVPGLTLLRPHGDDVFPFFYVVRVQDGRRDDLMRHLKEHGVGTGVHYIPNHIQPAFAEYATSLPVTDALFEQILTLPLYFEMRDEDVATVIDQVKAYLCKAAN
jgi:perosamine synthetase